MISEHGWQPHAFTSEKSPFCTRILIRTASTPLSSLAFLRALLQMVLMQPYAPCATSEAVYSIYFA